jgi:hypothetical protein
MPTVPCAGNGFVLAGSEVTEFGNNTANDNARAGLLHTPDPTGDECPLLLAGGHGSVGEGAEDLFGATGLTMVGNGEVQVCAAMRSLGLMYTKVNTDSNCIGPIMSTSSVFEELLTPVCAACSSF